MNNVYLVLLVLVSYLFYKIIPWFITRRMLNRWNNTPKDVVILHATPRGKTVPALSPFVLKLETYLKMAKIPYKLDTTDPLGPKGKMPWISLNGTHIGDSQLIIDYLSKKYDKNLDSSYSDEQLAIGTAVRIMLEEHFFWGFRRWIFLGEGRHTIRDEMNLPPLQALVLSTMYGYRINSTTKAQGLGLHSDQDIQKLMFKELRSVSRIIGNKKFLLGDEPCTDDAAVFGFLAGMVYGHLRNSPYGKLLKDELHNIEPYCKRMKERVWPDWEQHLIP